MHAAEQALAQGDDRAAVIELKNILKQTPDNARARWLLGRIHLQMGRGEDAEKELEQARGAGVPDTEVLPLLSKAHLIQGDSAAVEALRIPDEIGVPARIEMLTHKAEASLLRGSFTQSREYLRQALKYDAAAPEPRILQARLNFVQGRVEQAKQDLETVLENHPEVVSALVLKGDIQRAQSQAAAAEATYSKALEIDPDRTEIRVKRALIRSQQGELEAASADLQAIKARFPDHFKTHYALGVLAYYEDDYAQAQTLLERALAQNDTFMPAIYYLGLTHLALNNRQQAYNHLTQFLDRYPGYMPARKLLALTHFQDEHYERTLELLQPVLAHDPDDTFARSLQAETLFAVGEADRAVDILLADGEQGEAEDTRELQAGLGLLGAGDAEASIKYLQQAKAKSDYPQADILLIRALHGAGRIEEALAAVEDFEARFPDSVMPLNLKGIIHAREGNEAQAVAAFRAALEIDPDDAGARHNLAQIAIDNGEYAKAREHYQAVLDTDADHVRTLVKLAELDIRENRTEAAIARLERAVDQQQGITRAKLLLGRLYLAAGRPDDVFSLVRGDAAERAHPGYLSLQAEAQLAIGDLEAARRTVDRLLETTPDNPHGHWLRAQVLQRTGQRDGLESAVDRTLELDPEHHFARIAAIRLHIDNDRLEAAGEQLAAFVEDHPNALIIPVLRGELAQAEGDKDRALAAFRQAYEARQSRENLFILTHALWNFGEKAQALEQLRTWLQAHPEDLAVRTVLAKYHATAEDWEAARREYETALEQAPENIAVLNDLAWTLRSHEPDRALEYARRAIDLDPNNPAVMDTLAMIHFEQGDHAAAKKWIDLAHENAPDNTLIETHRRRINSAGP